MFRDLPRYEAYQVTSESRLPRLPTTWRWSRLASVGQQVREAGCPDLPLLSVYLDRGVIPYAEGGRRVHAPSERLDAYQVVRQGDLVLNNQQAWRGSVGVSAHHGIISPAYVIWRNSSAITAQYGTHLFRAPVMVDQFVMASRGVGDIQRDLHYPSLRNLLVPVPPLEHQIAIAKYLAHANARIDKAIAAKRRLISLLEEQKASVAYERLTRGYEPNDLRVVGLPWADSIPQHWALAPVKRLFSSMVYGTSESSTGEGPVTAVGMGEIRNGNVAVMRRGGLANIPEGLELRQNDLLFNRTNSPDLVGKVGRMTGDCEDLTFASYLVRCRVAEEIDPEWAAYLLNDRAFLGFARSQAFVSLHQANLSPTRYGALPAVIPPYDEQCRIADGLRKELAESNGAVDRVNREIKLLQEFRTRLVADVVTGQVDVRGVAATLPDVPLELFDNAIVELDDDLEEALVGSED